MTPREPDIRFPAIDGDNAASGGTRSDYCGSRYGASLHAIVCIERDAYSRYSGLAGLAAAKTYLELSPETDLLMLEAVFYPAPTVYAVVH